MGLLDKVTEQKQRTENSLARGKGGGTSLSAKWWRPGAGDNKIRLMPPWTNEKAYADQFWREAAQHWNVSPDQKGPVMCPKQTPGMGGDCPICEFITELKQDKTNLDAQKLAKQIKAKVAYFINVVDFKDSVYTAQDVAEFTKNQPDKDCPFSPGETKVQVYACPITVFDQILGLIKTSGQDITDLKKGRNLTLKKIAHKDPLKTRYECYPDLDKSVADVTDLKLIALDQVGYNMEYDKMLDLLHTGPASGYISSLPEASAAISLPKSTRSVTDLEADMRKELSQ